MKEFTRNFSIMILIALVAVLSFGCTRRNMQEQNTNFDESQDSATPATIERAIAEDITLFETIFIPAAQGKINTEKETFQETVTAYGFSCYEEAGVVLVTDPAYPNCFLRGEMLNGKEIDTLVYSCFLGEIRRQARVSNVGEDFPSYYIGVNEYDEGTRVESLEEVRTYLTAEVSPAETAPPETDTALKLFDEIYLPLADGRIENNAAAIYSELEKYGYAYRNSEGRFSICNPDTTDIFIYGDPSLLNDTDNVSVWGFHLASEMGEKEVEIFLFTNPKEYYICDPSTGNSTQVESLEELKNHISAN